MVRIEEINEENKPLIMAFINRDIIRHVFAVYDIQNEPKHTTTHAAFESDHVKGYILVYTLTDVPSVILECEENVAEKLLEHAPPGNFIAHAPVNLLPIVKKRFPDAKHYVEDWMLVKKNGATFFGSEQVRRLRTEEDALKLAGLLLSRSDRPCDTVKKYVKQIEKMPTFGVFKEGQLVSYAGSFIQLPQIWLIGGVYTHPDHRNRGLATLATSAITEEALRKADAAALFARSDNYPALKVYEKIGYRKIGEKVWVDVGTDLKP